MYNLKLFLLTLLFTYILVMQVRVCLAEFALVLVLVFCWVEDGTLEVFVWM